MGEVVHAIFVVVWLAVMASAIVGMAFWIVALIDVTKREFPGENEKLIWVLVVVLGHWIGALVYWFGGRDKGTLPKQQR